MHITLKYSDFRVVTRQSTISATCSTKEIYHTGCRLLEENWNRFYSVRLIGISISGFHEDCSSDQLSLFDQAQDNAKSEKDKRIDSAMDKIRNKHGSEIITLASLVRKEKGGK